MACSKGSSALGIDLDRHTVLAFEAGRSMAYPNLLSSRIRPAATAPYLDRATGCDNAINARRQQVQILFAKPESMTVSWDVGGVGYFDSEPLVVPGRYSFPTGGIYRLKVANIQGREGVERYPTLEVGPITFRTEAYLAHNAIPIQLTDEDFDEMMRVNVKSVLYGMQAVLPHFKKRGQGHLINVSSMLGRVPFAGFRSGYSAAKHALNSLTANLRMELKRRVIARIREQVMAALTKSTPLVVPEALVDMDVQRQMQAAAGPDQALEVVIDAGAREPGRYRTDSTMNEKTSPTLSSFPLTPAGRTVLQEEPESRSHERERTCGNRAYT